MMALALKLQAIIPLAAGILVTLMAYGVIPVNKDNAEKTEKWMKKYGKPMKWVGPVLVLYAVLEIFRLVG